MKKLIALTCLVLFFCNVKSQNVGIGTTSPHASAALEISGVNKGLLIPRMTNAQRNGIANPAKGLMVYDSSHNAYSYYDGKKWNELLTDTYNTDSSVIIGKQSGTIPSYNLTYYNMQANGSDSSGYLFDSGGPAGNYGNNQFYTFNIFPYYDPAAYALDIEVLSNDLENPQDSLFIIEYSNGYKRHAFTGNATGKLRLFGYVQVLFKSNATNTAAGFAIKWSRVYGDKKSNYDSTQLGGWYFNPSKLYMRGGVNTYNDWSPDSSGHLSFGFGSFNKVKGTYSTAMGYYNSAAGLGATALGQSNVASGDESIAMGFHNSATATASTSIGYDNVASGDEAIAIGYQANALGLSATAIGSGVDAKADFAVAIGAELVSKSYGGAVFGLFNDTANAASASSIDGANRIFQIGNGTEYFTRSNAMTVLQNGNVGIGTLVPNVKLDLNGNMRINDSALYLRPGTDINHGLKYSSQIDGPYLYGFTGGALAARNFPPALTWDYSGNVRIRNSLYLDTANINNGSFANVLVFGNVSGEGIGSKRTATGNQYGLDFYTASTNRMSITNGGTVQVANNLTVQNGKGIIRNVDGTQQKKLTANVTINASFAAGETKTFAITWPETFGGVPDAFVGNVVSGAGGWAEMVLTITSPGTTGATLYVYNPKTVPAAPNYTIKIIAIGQQ